MPPKGGNAKKEGGRAKKAENEEKKAVAASKAKEAQEADEWKAGSKGTSKADLAAAKQAELAKKKAEKEALLAAEEAALPSKPKSAPKAGSKKKAEPTSRPAGGGIKMFNLDDPLNLRSGRDENTPVEELSATGIEGMLEALEIANQKTDKQSMGAKAGELERHPERRFKAAFEAYKEDQMPVVKDEHPGLRKNQYEDMLYKRFQKAPENPFNQAQVAYNASKDEKLDKLKEVIGAREAKYKVGS